MIGFKTVEDYTYDECIVFLTEHNDMDLSWNEINQHYQHLLSHLLKEDEFAFDMCSTSQDYKNYLIRFRTLNGATKYQPLHEVEAQTFLKNHPSPAPIIKRGLFSSYIVDLDKRPPLTNIVLYLLLIASFIATLLQIPGVISTFGYYFEDGWPFLEAYGKGFMPGFLLSAFAFIGTSKIVKWKKSGLSIMIISFIIILIPTVCNEYLEFICFSAPTILSVAILWGFLKLKKNSVSTWELCKATPQWLGMLQRLVLFVWIFMVVLLPPIMALSTGFRGNLYSNGMRCLDAYFNDSPYYSYDLYQRILLGSDFSHDVYEKQNAAEKWLLNAKFLDKYMESDFELSYEDEFSQPVLFLNNLIFKMQNKGRQEAIEYINSEKNNLDMSIVFKYLNGEKSVMGEYEYFRPNKESVTSLLNEAEVYEYVEIEVPDNWTAPADEIAAPYEDGAE